MYFTPDHDLRVSVLYSTPYTSFSSYIHPFISSARRRACIAIFDASSDLPTHAQARERSADPQRRPARTRDAFRWRIQAAKPTLRTRCRTSPLPPPTSLHPTAMSSIMEYLRVSLTLAFAPLVAGGALKAISHGLTNAVDPLPLDVPPVDPDVFLVLADKVSSPKHIEHCS